MTTAKIIGKTEDGQYRVNIKPDNVPKGNMGGGGVVVPAANKQQAKALVDFYNGRPDVPLERVPNKDVFVSSANQIDNQPKLKAIKVPRQVHKEVTKITNAIQDKMS